ncbi:MAG: hypothetical protein AB1489_39505 [Acidobacteriota bacterium]
MKFDWPVNPKTTHIVSKDPPPVPIRAEVAIAKKQPIEESEIKGKPRRSKVSLLKKLITRLI